MLRKIRSSRAFTLVELMIVVAIIGLLAALAIYGVRRYMTNSKSAEARQAIGAISKGARAAYDGEVWDDSDTEVLDPSGKSTAASHKLCTSAKKVPEDMPLGEKYQSSTAEWDGDPGWSCLRFSMSGPQYFRYEYTSDEDSFDIIADAQLGGADDDPLTLSLAGKVQEGSVTIAPTIKEDTGAAAPAP